MSLVEKISSQPNARGLAIIITNDYTTPQPKLPCGHPKLKPLRGTRIDGQNMRDVFRDHQFSFHWESNISLDKFTELIHQATSYTGYTKFERYKCVVFVFSGHGDEGDLVYLQDGSQVSISEQIIAPFLPKESISMGKLQKLFLIDACRGNEYTKTIELPKGQSPKGKTDESRGGTVLEKIRIPDIGGFLVAYSTMPSHQAWELEDEGGAWLQRVAKRIREDYMSSIEDVLTAVNKDLVEAGPKKAQQPEKLSRLNDVVYLHPYMDEHYPGRRKKPEIPAISLHNSTSQHQVPMSASQGGTKEKNVHLNKLTTRYSGIRFQEYEHFPPEYKNVTYYRSTVTVTIPGQGKVVGDSKQYFVNVQRSREMAAKEALMKITETTARSIATPVCIEQMQTFFQCNKIKPQFEFHSDGTTSPTRYRCIVCYTMNGRQERINSGNYYNSKLEAKEQVAKLVLAQDKEASRGNAPPFKVWKSQLKEPCDKKGQPNPAYI